MTGASLLKADGRTIKTTAIQWAYLTGISLLSHYLKITIERRKRGRNLEFNFF